MKLVIVFLVALPACAVDTFTLSPLVKNDSGGETPDAGDVDADVDGDADAADAALSDACAPIDGAKACGDVETARCVRMNECNSLPDGGHVYNCTSNPQLCDVDKCVANNATVKCAMGQYAKTVCAESAAPCVADWKTQPCNKVLPSVMEPLSCGNFWGQF